MVIDLSEDRRIETDNHTSKGNQPKWLRGGKWYKADYMGYEALSETVLSSLLGFSNASSYVRYELVRIKYNGTVYNGCVSDNFKGDNEALIPFEKLYRSYTGRSLSGELGRITDVKERRTPLKTPFKQEHKRHGTKKAIFIPKRSKYRLK